VTAEQKRLAKAMAISDEIRELVTDDRPGEASTKERLTDVRDALADRRNLRELCAFQPS